MLGGEGEGSVVASCRSLRNILDLAVTSSGEILVLETPRSVVRLGRCEDSLAPASDWRRGSTVAQAADTQLAVLGFDISQTGELWVVGRGVREVTTQFLLSSVERVSSLVCSRLHAGEGRRPTLATSCSSWQAGLSGYQQEDPGSRVPALWRAAGPGLRGAGPPVGVDRERECLPPGQDWAVAQTEHQPAGRGQAGQPQSHYYYYY